MMSVCDVNDSHVALQHDTILRRLPALHPFSALQIILPVTSRKLVAPRRRPLPSTRKTPQRLP